MACGVKFWPVLSAGGPNLAICMRRGTFGLFCITGVFFCHFCMGGAIVRGGSKWRKMCMVFYFHLPSNLQFLFIGVLKKPCCCMGVYKMPFFLHGGSQKCHFVV